MAIRDGLIRTMAVSAAALPMLMGGCVSTSGEGQGTRLNDNLVVYAPFDNERDWGPGYLVEAPYHHLGDGVRVNDSRSLSPAAGIAPADPTTPPSTSGQGQTQTPGTPQPWP